VHALVAESWVDERCAKKLRFFWCSIIDCFTQWLPRGNEVGRNSWLFGRFALLITVVAQ
jgi:hypothetical protein